MVKKIGVLVSLQMLLLLSPGILGRPQAVPPSKPEPLVLAQEFLQAFYPDLTGKYYVLRAEASMPLDTPEIPAKALILEVTTHGSNAKMVIGGCLSEVNPPALAWPPELAPPDPKKPPEPRPDCKPRVIGARERILFSGFWFHNDGSIRDFDAEGPVFEQDASYKEFIRFLDSHSDLTNAEAMNGLETAGAKYPPQKKEEFRKHLPMAHLQRYLGKLHILSVQFSPPFDDDRFTGGLEWRVQAERERSHGPRVFYDLQFEPFGGHLVRLREKPSPHAPH